MINKINNAKCKYCTFSQGEFDPIEMRAFLLCNMIDKVVEPDGGCESFERDPWSDDE